MYVILFINKMISFLHTSQFKVCPREQCRSTPGFRTDLFRRDYRKVLVTDFFGSVRNVEISSTKLQLENKTEKKTGDKDGLEQEKSAERTRRKEKPQQLSYVQQFPVDEIEKVRIKTLQVLTSTCVLSLGRYAVDQVWATYGNSNAAHQAPEDKELIWLNIMSTFARLWVRPATKITIFFGPRW